VVPSPQLGAAKCPAAPGQADFLSQLAKVGVRVTDAAASTMQPIFKTSAVACFMRTAQASFDAAFFSDVAAAAKVRVCLTKSGSRYLYQINDQTVDSAEPIFWIVAGIVIVSTIDERLDAELKLMPGASTPGC
jgi:hypothetical protein